MSIASACVLTLSTSLALAAPSVGPEAVQADYALPEVVVTAEKRESSLQRTPISLTAITGDALQAAGITELTSVIERTPGVSFRTNGGPGQVEIQMRGMTSTGGESPTVGFYLDEIPITPPAQAVSGKVVLDPDLFDLNRIEILRGPQGTLYGAGSMGGTVRLLPNAPDLHEFQVDSRISPSETSGGGFNHSENAALNLPIIADRVALRVVASTTAQSGWIDRIVVNPFPLPTNPNPACGSVYGCVRGNVLAAPVEAKYRDVNDVTMEGGRASLLIQPIDRLSVDLMILYQHNSAGGASLYDSDPGTLAHYQPDNVPEPISDNFVLYSGVVKYHFDGFDLTSATGSWTRHQGQLQDYAEQMQEIFLTPAYSVTEGGLGSGPIEELDSSRQFSQELRLSSTASGPLQGILGAFFSNFDSRLYVNGALPGAQPLFGTPTIVFQDQPTHIKQWALFGEATYEVNSTLKATVGLRRYKYQSELGVIDYGAAFQNDSSNPTTSFNKTSDVGYNPRFNLAYTPSDASLLYATISKGFRPGAANGPVPLSGPTGCASELAALGRTDAPQTFGADQVWSYELGYKTELDERRIRVDTAAYYERWSKIQQQVVLNPCGWLYTDNLGTANIFGGEFEITTQIARGLTFSLNGGYTHARLADNEPAAGAVAGQPLQNVPTITGGGSAEYSLALPGGYRGTIRLSDNYTGHRVDQFGPLPGYALADFRLGVIAPRWSTYLFANNVFNRQVDLGNSISVSVATPLYLRLATNVPRTVGVEFAYKY